MSLLAVRGVRFGRRGGFDGSGDQKLRSYALAASSSSDVGFCEQNKRERRTSRSTGHTRSQCVSNKTCLQHYNLS